MLLLPMNSRVRALYRIDARPDGPARARRVVRSECSARMPRRTLEKLQLLVSELVTSGIVQGRSGIAQERESRGESITLDLGLNSTLRVAVVGPGGSATDTGWDLDDGWGLRVVERLADRWGIQRTPEGTRVWFETESG
jgi:hypothetical protein